jgi:excisionase family DNA binding protein
MDNLVLINKSDLEAMFKDVALKLQSSEIREVMTLKQLAEYLQASRQSLLNWTKRSNHPLPVHYIGADPRFHRSEVDQWSKEEADLKLKPIDLGITQ